MLRWWKNFKRKNIFIYWIKFDSWWVHLGGDYTENTIKNIKNSGVTENIINTINQGGKNSINFNMYLFDCVDSSVNWNTNCFDFNSFDFDCVDFNIFSLNTNFCMETLSIIWYIIKVSIPYYNCTLMNDLVSLSFKWYG